MTALNDPMTPWHDGLKDWTELDSEGCLALLNGVVIQAVSGWRRLAQERRKRMDDKGLEARQRAIERFITHGWCGKLVGVNGEHVVMLLRDEEGYK